MTLPDAGDPAPVDPFGLWQFAPSAALPGTVGFEEAVYFDILPGGGGAAPEQAAAVWQLALTSGPAGAAAGKQELDQRARQVQAIESGLDAAGFRIDTFLARRASAPTDESVSFALAEAETLPAAEQTLASLLDDWDSASAPEVSFGLREDAARLAGQVKRRLTGEQPGETSWEALRQRFDALMDSVNRQILHYAWVDTRLDGRLVARTMMNWGGDVSTLWQPGLSHEYTTAHCRSLELAAASRTASLRTVLTVSQIAGKIALAVATPLGPLQALSLGWQFVHDIVIPLLDPSCSTAACMTAAYLILPGGTYGE